MLSPGPTASEVVMADERLERVMARRSARQRKIVELRKGGATHAEIAAVLGVNPKTVQRALQRLERKVVS
jgi:DNA-directed RNA polymerase specialized sigma24 family protein